MQDRYETKLLSRAEVEAEFGLTRRFLEISAVRGDGPPFIKVGRLARYMRRDVMAWLEARRVRSTSDDRLANGGPST